MIGVLLLVVVVIGLPLYWIFEPPACAAAAAAEEETFIERGAALFAPTGDNPGPLNCAGCHRHETATGGEARLHVASATTGEVRAVDWKAPALNTVFTASRAKRCATSSPTAEPGSPMSAWGLDGGGPLNSQQIDTLLAYLESIQIPREDCIPEEEVTRSVRADTCRPRSRLTSSKQPGSPSRTARTTAMARRCSTSI